MFFKEHPEFLTTSETAVSKRRLNARHRVLIEQNRDLLKGRRVLDIASHDGRWSFAALEAGASEVIGIEGRADLVANAEETITAKGIDPSRFSFVVGDVHDVLSERPPQVDVVMCFGFLYHTLRYGELFAGIRATGAQHLIIDTRVLPKTKAKVIRVYTNPAHIQSMAVEDRLSVQGISLAGTPSMSALTMMLGVYGFEIVSTGNWQDLLSRAGTTKHLARYARGGRVTFVAKRLAS